MFPTVEVRWFLPGRVPTEVEEWFERVGVASQPAASRVDHYLRLDGEGALGIKAREGRIEVKKRQGSGELVQLHRHVSGRLEHWRKWSFALDPVDASHARTPTPTDAWIAVDKARLLCRYRVTGTQRVVMVPPTEYPDEACDWELTRVRVAGRAWWTVAFEAYGRESHLEQTFHTVVAHVLGAQVPPAFRARDSLGYPAWLAMLDQRRG